MSVKLILHVSTEDSARASELSRLLARIWRFDDGKPALLTTQRLNSDGKTAFAAEEEDREFEIEVTDSAGRVIFESQKARVANNTVQIRLPSGASERIPKPLEAREPPRTRAGRFRVLSHPDFRFDEISLAVVVVDTATQARIKAAFPDAVQTADGWVADADENLLRSVVSDLQRAHLGFDGQFRFQLELQKEVAGWVYVLMGKENFVGFFPEDLQKEIRKDLTIFLPVEEDEPLESDSETAPDSDVPLDVTEDELVEHPEIFSDDPGPYCRPFKNPERVLGERRFQTILRSEQPEILGTLRTTFSPLPANLMHDLGRDQKLKTFLNVRDTGKKKQIELGRTTTVRTGRAAPGPSALIDWENDILTKQAVTVAGGHLLEWGVRWRSAGYSLGTVNHTLTLAPRQTKRIIKIDFERAETARRQEITTVDDEVDQSTVSTRDYRDAVQASLHEWAVGSSQSAAAGAAGGVGGYSGVVFGGGAAAGAAASASQQAGGRTTAAVEEQNLRDAIRQHGESLRQLQSSVITETNQRETTEGVSEVIYNPNYCHALTIVYYNILRHLRVDTELTGISECLFVPFSITPFAQVEESGGFIGHYTPIDIRRILRHRDALLRALRDRSLRWVFPYLSDYANAFFNSSVPQGRRMDQTVISLRGSFEIELDIASPLMGDEEANALQEARDAGLNERETAAHVVKWFGVALSPFQALGIGIAVAGAVMAEATAREREQLFENELAPIMARKFIDRLRLSVNGNPVEADFTLRGNYGKGRIHRVYFNVTKRELERVGLTRADLEEVRISSPALPEHRLPNNSIANITSARIRMATEHYQKTLTDTGVHDDVIAIANSPSAVHAASEFAVLNFPATAWEKENLQQKIRSDVERLVQHLDSHLFYYHKAIWEQMDADEMFTILDGYTVSETDTRSIASLVEYRPMSIVGNTLVFRVARGAFVGVNGFESLDEARALYEPQSRNSDSMRVSLPTSGVYAQALMDECNACEPHYGSTDWVLEQDEIRPQELDSGLLSSRRSNPQDLTPTQLPETLINLQNAPAAPAPSGLSDAFGAVTNANAFRDMAGLAGTQANARAALESAASLAKTFGNLGAKQMDAERDAIARVNNDPNLSESDKDALKQKHTNPPAPSKDVFAEAKELLDDGFQGQLELKQHDPANPESVLNSFTADNRPGGDVQFATNKPKSSALGKDARAFASKAFDRLVGAISDAAGTDTPLQKVVTDTMTDLAKEELEKQGLALAKKIPMGNALVVGAQVAYAMAEGIGEQMQIEGDKLREQYEKDLKASQDHGDGLTPEGIEAILNMSRWQATNASRLEKIVRAGIRSAIDKGISLAAGTVSKVLEAGFSDYVNAVAKNNEILSLASQMVDEAATNKNPSQRQAQAKMIRYLVGQYADQTSNAKLSDALKDLVKPLRGDQPIVLEIYAGMAHAIKEAAQDQAAPYAQELRLALLDRISEVKVEAEAAGDIENSSDDHVEIEGDVVRVPAHISSMIAAHNGQFDERKNLAFDAVIKFETLLSIASQEMLVFAEEQRIAALNNPAAFEDYKDLVLLERDKKCTKLRNAYQKLQRAISTIYGGGLTGDGITQFMRATLLFDHPPHLEYRQLDRRSFENRIDLQPAHYSILDPPFSSTPDTTDL